MKFTVVAAAILSVLSVSSSVVDATDYAISGFSQSNCAFSSAVYATQKSGTDFKCNSFGRAVQGVEFNGNNFWCVGLYSDNNCKSQVKYLKSGVSGCQSGSFQSYFIFIPSHGASC
ncbi:hypothetical protein EDD11_003458 [Mortierella claussenii]|nr:hypothetical protein EDD11_003458 [Mortierella claussenii]